jgi:MFS family permease
MVLAMTYGIFSSLMLPLETVMLPIYANDLFGEKSFGKIIGLLSTACYAGIALGSPLTNLCFDVLGSYKLSLLLCAGLMAVSIILLQFVINSVNKVKKNIQN